MPCMQCLCEALRMHMIYWCKIWAVMLLLASEKPQGCFDLFLFTTVRDVQPAHRAQENLDLMQKYRNLLCVWSYPWKCANRALVVKVARSLRLQV